LKIGNDQLSQRRNSRAAKPHLYLWTFAVAPLCSRQRFSGLPALNRVCLDRRHEAPSRSRQGARSGPILMTKPQTIELWPCGYTAKCSAPECRRRATTILRYLDGAGPTRTSDRRLRHPRARAE
jgi:hypothetical protein